MPDVQNCYAQTVVAARAARPYLPTAGADAGEEETMTVKILLSAAALVGSLGLLVSGWAQQAVVPYL
jgi:hypothetical protein